MWRREPQAKVRLPSVLEGERLLVIDGSLQQGSHNNVQQGVHNKKWQVVDTLPLSHLEVARATLSVAATTSGPRELVFSGRHFHAVLA